MTHEPQNDLRNGVAAEWGLASLLTGGVLVLTAMLMLHINLHIFPNPRAWSPGNQARWTHDADDGCGSLPWRLARAEGNVVVGAGHDPRRRIAEHRVPRVGSAARERGPDVAARAARRSARTEAALRSSRQMPLALVRLAQTDAPDQY